MFNFFCYEVRVIHYILCYVYRKGTVYIILYFLYDYNNNTVVIAVQLLSVKIKL